MIRIQKSISKTCFLAKVKNYFSARHVIFSNDGFLLTCYGDNHLVNYTVNGSKVHDSKGKFLARSLKVLINDSQKLGSFLNKNVVR